MESADFHAVSKALVELDIQPEGARKMLLDCLPFAVTVRNGEQHKYVLDLQTMIRDVLVGAQPGAADRDAQCQAALLEAQTKHKVLEEAVTAALATEEAARAGVSDREDELRVAEAEVQAEDSQWMVAQARADTLSFEADELEEQRCKAASLHCGAFRELVDASWQDDNEKDGHVAAVQAYLRSIHAEPCLVSAAPGALGRKPDIRVTFDITTVNAINKAIESKLAALDTDISAGKPTLRAASAEALGAWAIRDVARERSSNAIVELANAKKLLSDSSVALQAAEENVLKSRLAQSDLLTAKTMAGESVNNLATALDALSRLVACANAPAESASLEVRPAAPDADVEIQEEVAQQAPEADKAAEECDQMRVDVAPMGA